ncbi:MAG: molybdopterin molybdotransferase [Glaciecola sp.]|jgi:molybdopterin molybdotransferase
MDLTCDAPGLMSLEEAKKRISDLIPIVQELTLLPLQDCLDRISAADVYSPIDVPGYNNSAMDGYAFRLQDLKENGCVKLVGKSFAGNPFSRILGKGECIKIMTGAAIPEGADTVVMQENAELTNKEQQDFVSFSSHPKIGSAIRLAGEDIKKDSRVVSKGNRICAADIGLLASLGCAQVSVYRQVRVAMFSTGDELMRAGDNYEAHRIYDSNRPAVVALLHKMNCDVIDLGIVPDDKDQLRKLLSRADLDADCVITSGGVSVGEADFIKEILAELGQIDFWKIAIKPGKPLAFGRLPNSIFFGLPGNPVSAFVTFHQIAADALRLMSGEIVSPELILPAIAASSLKKRAGRTDYQRGKCFIDATGQLVVESTGAQGSGVFSSFSESNCYIILERERDSVAAGETVNIQLFDRLLD